MIQRWLAFLVFSLIVSRASGAALDPNAFASLGTFNPGSNVTVNTDTLSMSGGVTVTGVNASGIAVFTFASVTLGSGITVSATGSRPFALLSRGAMSVSGTIDVSATGSSPGAGGFAGNTHSSGGFGLGPGAGGGDSQGGGGAGHGGFGGSTSTGAIAGPAYGDLALSLQGGSGGGRGTFLALSGAGGGGGGALELGAVGTLTLNGTAILRANGGAGANFVGNQADGGGGGSGGAIYLHGSSTQLNSGAQLRADGGAGGNGGTQGTGGGGGAGGRIRAENLGTNAATVSAAGGGGSTGSFGTGFSGSVGQVLLIGTPSVSLAQSGGNTVVSESSGSDSYTLVLGAQPSGTVTITISPDAQVSVSPSTLSFTTSNWASAQTVTVTAINDAIAEGAHTGTITHTASGGGYSGVSIGNVVASITDNDSAAVTLTQTGGNTAVTEAGGTDTYSLVLTSQPTATVTIDVNQDSQLSVTPGSLNFTAVNWNTPQTVTVSAVNDAVAEGTHNGSITHSASGGGYTGVSISGITATISDNDSVGVTLSQSGGNTAVAEGGGQDQYQLVLTSEPTGNVTVRITPDSQLGTNPAMSLLFTSSNWNLAQAVTVQAIDDAVFEGNHNGLIQHVAQGGGYDAVAISGLTVDVADNDLQPVDLAIAQSLLTPVFGPGERIRFEINVEHLSINTVPGTAQIQLATSPELSNLSWLCAADPGASCPGNGNGPIAHQINLGPGLGVTYVVSADVALTAPPGTTLNSTANVSANAPDSDLQPANNQAILSFQVGVDRVFRDSFED